MPRVSLMSGLIIVFVAACATRATTTDQSPRPRPRSAAPWAGGQLIVKFQPEAAAAVERARREERFPAVGIASLEALFAEFGINRCQRVFPDRPNQTDDPVGLARIYVLWLGSEAPVEGAVQAFSQDPAIEYAEPNYTATLHSDSAEPSNP